MKNKRKKSKNSNGKNVLRLLTVAGAVVIIYFLFFHGPRSVVQYIRQTSYKKQLEKDIQSLEKEKQQLEKEAKRLKTDMDYIEKIAREKYNMKKKNEKVYKIVKEK
ncbi:MAG: septum formation initiator family protein [Caldisericaceae bacterium]|nr:septum formation initiator family protein [Caldisericaceae bacterium]